MEMFVCTSPALLKTAGPRNADVERQVVLLTGNQRSLLLIFITSLAIFSLHVITLRLTAELTEDLTSCGMVR